MTVAWSRVLSDQLTWHWEQQLRPRLAGLSDEEYFWEPVDGCWNVRRRGRGGRFTIDFAFPAPEPPPVTTIAWRLAHVIVGVFGMRVATHFGGPAVDYDTFDYAGTAERALAQLDAAYAAWVAGVAALDDDALARPCGPPEAYPDLPMAALVLHIHREVIHHGAEIALLRDLFRDR
ncbi:DinB family protein [Catenuloplanes atrovinosus]|uniref:DinB-like domain-containing protein n=1 Tax=Catenuloplanes atrovinosus TaxID=137266 RepID=A0AAE3YLU7_9ACTN|nr:DinB family protein [Catenuloplanes atrovinosus]MDR7274892.1 hypothetical protein [Catenuloplanes atrovinosus]